MLQSIHHYLYIIHFHAWLCLLAALKVGARFNGASCGDRFLPHDPPPAPGLQLPESYSSCQQHPSITTPNQ